MTRLFLLVKAELLSCDSDFDLTWASAFCLMGLQNILRYVFRKRNWWWSGFSMPRPHLSTSGCLLLMLDLRFAPFSLNLELDNFLSRLTRNYVETYIKNNGPCCCRWSWGKPQVCISSTFLYKFGHLAVFFHLINILYRSSQLKEWRLHVVATWVCSYA